MTLKKNEDKKPIPNIEREVERHYEGELTLSIILRIWMKKLYKEEEK
jgi:hypothetical protein